MPTKIEIRGAIIPNDYQWIYDLFEIDATSPKKVTQAIAAANGDELEVVINSGGGDVFSGSEIYTALKEHAANVTVKIVGVAASAATVAAMGGNKIVMSPTGQFMIHNASTWTEGDKRDHQHTAEFLKSVDSSIANAYRLKTGLQQSELTALMNRETWMNAQEAKEKGFIDEIMFDEDGQLSAVASISAEMIPHKVISKIRNEFVNLKNQGVSNTMAGQNQDPNNQQQQQQQQQQQPAPASPQANTTPAPAATPQASAPTIDAAVQERSRLKAIDEISANIDPELVNEAKYGENPMTAEQLAFKAMKEGKMLNSNLFEQSVQANKAAGTDDVQAQAQQQGSDKEYDLENLKDVNAIYASFAAAGQAGRRQNMTRG
ncbi:head maturation protease, ClpP-related [Paenibacillus sp. GCM10027626]|uniref:head maturation protease, ClpP-related n=1 Tax=Paenibacillus sp. GCM10027626 TaxID=3273411 RepID=UPI00362E18FE